MRKLLSVFALIVCAIVAVNLAFVTVPAMVAKNHDPRNAHVRLYAHMRWGVDPTTIVADLWGVTPEASMADVDRVLFDTAEAFQNKTFSQIELAWRGSGRFLMDGDYFRQIGRERVWQNPVFVIRTLPENLKLMNGQPAFGTWTGGWLGVINQQMEDHKEFHRQWYLKELF